jgi:hypothetical protein
MTNNTAKTDFIKWWSCHYRQPYVDHQLTVRHDAVAYIRGWVETLDVWDSRSVRYDYNPYSRHYDYSRYKSWEAGRDDAWEHLNT